MLRTLAIALLAALAACSAPDQTGSPDQNPTDAPIDVGVDIEVGVDVRRPTDHPGDASTDDAETPRESGELLTDLAALDATNVVLRDAGEFLFLLGDQSRLAWMSKEEPTIISFARWPDTENEGAGPSSRDFVHDDERVWFLAELGDGTGAIVGAAHDLGNPFPLFGQPIVIIDVGPLTAPTGLGIHQGRFVAIFGKDGGREEPTLVVATEAGGVSERVGVPTVLFDHLESLPDGVAFWTVTEAGGATLEVFSSETGSVTRAEREERPVAWDAHDGEHAWLLRNGDLWRLAANDSEPSVVATGVTESDDPQIATNGDFVAVAAGGTIHLLEGGSRTAIDADGAVHSLIVDSSSIFWSTMKGVHRYDVTR